MPSTEYQIEILASAEKDLRRLDSTTFERVAKAIDSLATTPRPMVQGNSKGELTFSEFV